MAQVGPNVGLQTQSPLHPMPTRLALMPKPLLAAIALVGTLALTTLVVTAPAPAEALPSALTTEAPSASIPMPLLRVDYSALIGARLSGRVPDEAEHDAILRRARSIYGADQVIDRIETGGVANPSWLSPAFLPDLRSALRASATLHDARLVIDGVAASEAARDQMVAGLAGYASRGVRVDTNVEVRPTGL